MSYLSVEKKKDIAIITSNNKRIDASFANQFRDDVLELKSKRKQIKDILERNIENMISEIKKL